MYRAQDSVKPIDFPARPLVPKVPKFKYGTTWYGWMRNLNCTNKKRKEKESSPRKDPSLKIIPRCTEVVEEVDTSESASSST